jgi:hypothetical protein
VDRCCRWLAFTLSACLSGLAALFHDCHVRLFTLWVLFLLAIWGPLQGMFVTCAVFIPDITIIRLRLLACPCQV